MDDKPITDQEQEKAKQQQYLANLQPVGKSKIIDPNGKVVYAGKLYNFTDYRFRTILYLGMGVVLITVGLANGYQPAILFGFFSVLFGLYIFVRGRKASKDN